MPATAIVISPDRPGHARGGATPAMAVRRQSIASAASGMIASAILQNADAAGGTSADRTSHGPKASEMLPVSMAGNARRWVGMAAE